MKARTLEIIFSAFLFLFATSCASNKGKSARITSMDDLHGKRIGVTMGTTHDEYATNAFPDAEILRLESVTDLTAALNSGQADVIILDGALADLLCTTTPQLSMLEPNIYYEPFGIGFHDQSLRDEFNIFLASIRSSGLLKEIIDRWSKSDMSAEMPAIDYGEKVGELTIGTDPLLFPFTFIKDGMNEGIDIEMMSRFCASKQMVPKFVTMPFSSLIAAVTTGKVDAIASSITITAERKKNVIFSDSYYDSYASAVIYSEPEDKNWLDGKVLGVLTGSAQDIFATATYTDSKVLRYDNVDQMVLALHDNVCNAVMLDYYATTAFLKEHEGYVILRDSVKVDSICVISSFGNERLINKFNHFLSEFVSSGERDTLVDKWIFNNQTVTAPDIPNSGDDGVLVIGTTGEAFPFSYVINGNLAGFDVEMVERFAASINKKPVFQAYTFSGLIAAVMTHKVDMATNHIMPTAERKQKVLYSDPYITSNTCIIVPKEDVTGGHKTWVDNIKESFYNNIIKEKRYMMILNGLKNTLIISLLSIIFGTLFGGVVCAMRMSKNKILKGIAAVYISLLRGIPQVVLLMIMFYVVFASIGISGITVAIITFSLNFAAYVSEMFRTAIESIDRGQMEAGVAMGFSKVQTFVNIIFPQALTRVLPVYKGEFISLVKMTSIVGYIAVQDLTKMGDIIRSRTFDAFFPLIFVAAIYFLIAWLLTLFVNMIEVKASPRRKTK
ncbi:MAG: ABC transporter permease subunit [Bacteroidales bacterium]|nr:ABC transporter permease subunit [Bacteroidales bacterium]